MRRPSEKSTDPASPLGDVVTMDAVALSAAIAARRISCAEVMAATLEQIERFNPRVNAIVALRDAAALMAEARQADARLMRQGPDGPLHGFPFAVKDLAAARSLPFTKGSPILKDQVAEADCVMVERLRAAGAIVIGKTNTPEFGLGSQTTNPVYGATRNAYDLSRTSGGSSGGAAVALALRMLPLADGSDYGGSLRNPAGWNNVFGFRPGYGRIPTDGRDLFLPSMTVLGPMARSVADLALLFSVQAGYDPRDPLSLPDDGTDFARGLDVDVKGKRIAWVGDFGGAIPYEPGVLALCETAMKTFETLGCVVEPARPDYPIEDVWRAWVTLRHWQVGANLLEHYRDPAKRALMKPEAIWEVERGFSLSAFDISAAGETRAAWYQAVRRFFERYDAFVLPTAQVFPFDVNLMWPRAIAGQPMESYHHWMQCVVPATMSGCPTLAAPAGLDARGLPMGVQIVAPNRAERACLQLARAYDLATRWPEKRPPPLLGEAAG